MALLDRILDYFNGPMPEDTYRECEYKIVLKKGKKDIFLFVKLIKECNYYDIEGDDVIVYFEFKNLADAMYEYCYYNAPKTYNDIHLVYFNNTIRTVLHDRWVQFKRDYKE